VLKEKAAVAKKLTLSGVVILSILSLSGCPMVYELVGLKVRIPGEKSQASDFKKPPFRK